MQTGTGSPHLLSRSGGEPTSLVAQAGGLLFISSILYLAAPSQPFLSPRVPVSAEEKTNLWQRLTYLPKVTQVASQHLSPYYIA